MGMEVNIRSGLLHQPILIVSTHVNKNYNKPPPAILCASAFLQRKRGLSWFVIVVNNSGSLVVPGHQPRS